MPLKNIIIAYDGFDRKQALPTLASALAQEHGARLHLLHVVSDPPRRAWRLSGVSADELYQALVEKRMRQLDTLANRVAKKGVEIRTKIRTGSPHVEIIREAMSIAADLVIVSDEPIYDGQRGFRTVTTKLLRECPCPVLAKRDHRKYKHRRIVAAVDVAPSPSDQAPANHCIVEMAGQLAKRAAGTVFLFHCWSLWGETLLQTHPRNDEEVSRLLAAEENERLRGLEQLIDECQLSGVELEIKLLKGDIRKLLPEFVAKEKIDLVVMGTVARKGVRRLIIGNTAEKLINELTCSVLAIKPEGFISPVSPNVSPVSPNDEESKDTV